MIDVVQRPAGQFVLEIGCGSGVLDLWPARYMRLECAGIEQRVNDFFQGWIDSI